MTISATPEVGTIAPNSSFAGAIEADAVIIGAGPVGLFQVFELGLLKFKATFQARRALRSHLLMCIVYKPDLS